jgi:hypothetical protein
MRALSIHKLTNPAILILRDLQPGLWLGLPADRGPKGLNLASRLMGSTLSELELAWGESSADRYAGSVHTTPVGPVLADQGGWA